MTDSLNQSCRVMIAAAMKDEFEPLVKAFGFEAKGDHFTLRKGGFEWIAVQFGIGEAGVTQNLKPAIECHQPDRLLVLGFAGGLNPSVKIGDLHCLESAQVSSDGQQLAFNTNGGVPSAVDVEALAGEGPAIFTAHLPVTCPDSKAELFEKTGCMLVDMESFHIASLCAEINLPVKIWRAVSDTAGDSIPRGLIAAVRSDGTVNLFNAIRYLALRPWLWATAIRLRSHSRRAAASLVHAIRSELDATD